MPTLNFFFQYALAITFAVSGVAKLLDRPGSQEALRGFKVPERFVPVGTYLLPGAELLAALLLLFPGTAVFGAGLTCLLLAAFIAAIAVNLAQGRAPDCHCFGQVHSAPISWWTVARNLLLFAMSTAVLVSGGTGPNEAFHWMQALTRQEKDLLWVLAGITALGAVGWTALWRNQRAILDKLGDSPASVVHDHDVAPSRLSIGVAAPSFALSDLEGNTVTLGTLLKKGAPTLLVFTSTDCVHCAEVLPDVGQWQRSLSQAVTVAVVSTGAMEDNQKKAEEFGLQTVLLQQDYEVLEAYGGGGTPSAVAISSEGLVTSELGGGPEGVRAVLNGIMSDRVKMMWEKATGSSVPVSDPGLKIGTEVPDVVAPGPEGVGTRLRSMLEGRTSVLLFWSATCGFCDAILPEMRELEAGWVDADDRQMVFISSGPPELNDSMGFKGKIVVDEDFSIGDVFKATGTPSAVTVDPEGHIASQLAVGTEEVLELVRTAAKELEGPSRR
jgi:peroxiredoxin